MFQIHARNNGGEILPFLGKSKDKYFFKTLYTKLLCNNGFRHLFSKKRKHWFITQWIPNQETICIFENCLVILGVTSKANVSCTCKIKSSVSTFFQDCTYVFSHMMSMPKWLDNLVNRWETGLLDHNSSFQSSKIQQTLLLAFWAYCMISSISGSSDI